MEMDATVTSRIPCSAAVRDLLKEIEGHALEHVYELPQALSEQDAKLPNAITAMDRQMKGWQRLADRGTQMGFGGGADDMEMWFQCYYRAK